MGQQRFDIRTGVTLSKEVVEDIKYLENVFAVNKSAVIRMAVSLLANEQRTLRND